MGMDWILTSTSLEGFSGSTGRERDEEERIDRVWKTCIKLNYFTYFVRLLGRVIQSSNICFLLIIHSVSLS